MKRLIMATVALGSMSIAATAQDLTYFNGNIGYSSLEFGPDRLDSLSTSAAAGFNFGQLDAFVRADSVSLDVSGSPSTDVLGLDLSVAYEVAPGFSLGLNYGRLSAGSTRNELYEISATYSAGAFWVSGHVGRFDTSFQEDDSYGVAVGYDFGQGTEIAIDYLQSGDILGAGEITSLALRHRGAVFSGDARFIATDNFDFLSADGNYSVTNEIGIRGLYSRLDDGSDVLSMVGLGATYAISSNLDAYADLRRLSSGSGDEANGFGFGISVDLGDKPLRQENTYDRTFAPIYFSDASILTFRVATNVADTMARALSRAIF